MTKYIEVDKAKAELLHWSAKTRDAGNPDIAVGYENAIAVIGQIPPADVAPVVHGEWIKVGDEDDGFVKCSECDNEIFITDGFDPPGYCFECGAQMDGKEANNG